MGRPSPRRLHPVTIDVWRRRLSANYLGLSLAGQHGTLLTIEAALGPRLAEAVKRHLLTRHGASEGLSICRVGACPDLPSWAAVERLKPPCAVGE